MPRPSQTRSAVKDKVDRSSIHFQKTKMCKFHLLGVCTRGAQCSWAHSQDELKNLPDFYRTKLATRTSPRASAGTRSAGMPTGTTS